MSAARFRVSSMMWELPGIGIPLVFKQNDNRREKYDDFGWT